MSKYPIVVENLSKSYLIGHRLSSGGSFRYTALRDEINNFASKAVDVIRGRPVVQGDKIEEFWALKDVSFEVKQGEVLGIIGRNGAGKSTLLKILSRITEPSEGRVRLGGRVGSLLEVGTGFHPELSGRENVYLNGAILGMTRTEINRKFDEIVDFSGVEQFLGTPVKRYSSGMYVRLAFAVAAHLEPEILVVDEVLGVGDAEFQRKCLGKMNDVAGGGRTVLFVSHNLGAVKTLTSRCLHLESGRVVGFGSSGQIIEHYLMRPLDHGGRSRNPVDYYRRNKNPDSLMTIINIAVLNCRHNNGLFSAKDIGDELAIDVDLEVIRSVRDAHIAVVFRAAMGETVATITSLDNQCLFSFESGYHKVHIEFGRLPLAPGRYLAQVGIGRLNMAADDVIVDYPLLQVENNGQVIHDLDRPWGHIHWTAAKWQQTCSAKET